MIKIQDKRTLHLVIEITKIIVGMIVALSWDTAVTTLINIIKKSFPIAGLLLSFIYAIIITVVAVIISILFLKKIDYTEESDDENTNDNKNN